jgi:hypothetical protein
MVIGLGSCWLMTDRHRCANVPTFRYPCPQCVRSRSFVCVAIWVTNARSLLDLCILKRPLPARASSYPFLADAGSCPGNCSGMEEATGAPSSLPDWDPKRLRASGRDGETVMTESPLPLTMLLSRHTKSREFITLLGGAAATRLTPSLLWPMTLLSLCRTPDEADAENEHAGG